MEQKLIVEILNEDTSFIPQRKTEGSVGYDLKIDLNRTLEQLREDNLANELYNKSYNRKFDVNDCNYNPIGEIFEMRGEGLTLELLPEERIIVSTGIKVAIPKGYEGQIRVRSGMAVKHGLEVVNAPGTIDWDYRGEVKVILRNSTPHTPIIIKHGERIAQLVISPVATPDVIVDKIDDTLRGEGGFGSTGSK